MKGRLVHLLCLLITRLNSALATDGGLKWIRVNIPQYRVPGEIAKLQCDYDLGNDSLYSVKWYKDHEEFYRFVPRARPEATSYRIEGISVDMNLSDSRKVVLNPVDLNTSGFFRCEVSAEAPSFSSAQSEARMEVVSLPNEDPIITGVGIHYRIGDELNLNCTSGKSHPASLLQWYINGQKVMTLEELIEYAPAQHSQGLVSSILGLKTVLRNNHFLKGSMKVKCVASVSPVLWRGDKESVVQSLPITEMREALLLVTNWANRNEVLFAVLILNLLNLVAR